MPDDALDISKININPGGKQRAMRVGGGVHGKSQMMNYSLRILKGKRIVLQERGVNISGMNIDKMREILASHPDLKF